jgi:hypothetical protein
LPERGTRLVFESGRLIANVARDLGIDSEPEPAEDAASFSVVY